ncbi:EAL and HDOD domain-containing protein [Algibacillus agarilyticus]|uniref:EAL and HDOD domain-containing protein n=1 Tax=Algibacillus agarilyticus TaxID=2234133 RepID=UPI000DCFC9BD|nr:HDOD domain-containing protein [Algibacillus agarilyticus]
MAQVYASRIPIFNKKHIVKAYQISFKEGLINAFDSILGQTSGDVTSTGIYLNNWLKRLTDNRPCVLLLNQQELLSHYAEMLPKEDIVIELSETIVPDAHVIETCKDLFHKGYTLMVQDYVFMYEWEAIYPLVKIIKFDLNLAPLDSLIPLLPNLKKEKLKLLVCPINDYASWGQCQLSGFDFFQGDYFCKPKTLNIEDIATHNAFILSIYQEVLKDEFSYQQVQVFFERDVSLCYKLFRYVNSNLIQKNVEITSVKQAITYLGEDSLRRFICLVATAHMGSDKPGELTKFSILRARFCQLMSIELRYSQDTGFICGLFSCLDAILDKPMDVILKDVPVTQDVKDALIESTGPYAVLLALVKQYEKANWQQLDLLASSLEVSHQKVARFYNEGIRWCRIYEEVNGYAAL